MSSNYVASNYKASSYLAVPIFTIPVCQVQEFSLCRISKSLLPLRM